MTPSQELVRGTVVPIVLAMLNDRPMYGYEIVKLVNARSNGLLEWREGSLYPALHKLEGDGLVRAEWRDAAPTGAAGDDAGARKRKYYALTGSGRRELKRRAAEWTAFTSAVNGLLRGA